MKQRFLLFCFRRLVLASLLLSAAAPAATRAAPVPPAASSPPTLAAPASASPGPGRIDPSSNPTDPAAPDACYTPANMNFGQDLEALVTGPSNIVTKPYQISAFVSQVDSSHVFSATQSTLATVTPKVGSSTIKTFDPAMSVAALGQDKAVAVWRQSGGTYDGRLLVQFWHEVDGWKTTNELGNKFYAALPYLNNGVPYGDPVVFAPNAAQFYIFQRNDAGALYYIKYSGGSFGEWMQFELPEPASGYLQVASDPAVVALDPQRLLVFFAVSNTNTPSTYELYFNQSVGDSWYSFSKSLGSIPGTVISPPQAVTMGSGRAGVFVHTLVSGGQRVYAKMWSIDDHKPDWSDTAALNLLASDVNVFTVGSPGNNRMALAYQNANTRVVNIQEWAPKYGWKAAAAVGTTPPSYLLTSLTYVSTFSNEAFLIASMPNAASAATFNSLLINKFTTDLGWSPTWMAKAPNALRANSRLVAVPRTAHSALVLAVEGAGASDKPVIYHWTTIGRDIYNPYIFQKTPTNNLSANGNPDGQRIVSVDGKPYWLNLYYSAPYWKIEVRDPSTWKGSVFTLNHADSGSQDYLKASLAVADMDRDSRDEVVIATLSSDKTRVDLSWLRLTPTNNTETIMSATITKLTTQQGTWDTPVSVAIGDLDGGTPDGSNATPDGIPNEVFVSYPNTGRTSWRVQYYQFTSGALTLQHLTNSSQYYATLSPKDNTSAFTTLNSAAGLFDPVIPGDAVVFLVGRGTNGNSELDSYKLSVSSGVRYFSTTPYKKISSTGVAMGSRPVLATGDVNADTVDEVVVIGSSKLYSIQINDANIDNFEDALNTNSGVSGTMRIALGDIDQDGRQEIWMVNGSGNWAIIKAGPKALYLTGTATGNGAGSVPLVADLDGDSNYATFDRCETYTAELTVHHVFYTPPVFYSADKTQALQNYNGEFAISHGVGNENERGYHINAGASIGVGTSVEFNAPLAAVHLGGFKVMASVETMATVGRSTVTSQSSEMGGGWSASGPSDTGENTRGRVLYSKRTFSCFYYTLHDPNNDSLTYPMQVCMPPSAISLYASTIENWYADTSLTGDNGWLPLDSNGEPSTGLPPINDVLNSKYNTRSSPPVADDQVLAIAPTPIKVITDTNWTTTNDSWYFGFEQGEAQVRSGSLEVNLTLSNEMDFGGVATETSLTSGYGEEWSQSQSWSNSVTFGGSYQLVPPKTVCSYCTGYAIFPYVYSALGRTNNGRLYRYTVQDYYVSERPASRGEAVPAGAEPPLAPQQAPLAPLVTSTTHPNPDAWYGSDPAFTWSQPAGDTAPLVGYRWFITQSPEDSPSGLKTISANQESYTDLNDGVYYFHVLAVGLDGALSPVTHYRFQVDATPPTPTLSFDPAAPAGLNGWFTQPVSVILSATDEPSGLVGLEYSTDGATWTPYTAPLPFNTDTPGITLSARATDNAGNVSEPVSTTIKIDTGVPSLRDADNQRLSYATIEILPNGNAQLVLGGVIKDTLSGRSTVLLKGGENGLWTAAGEIGDFDVPPGNLLPSTQSSLNWFYRPTFDVRGVYPLYAYGMDVAGNPGNRFLIGTFWWEPDAAPDLSESMASASPATAHPGDTVAFTVAARNTGFQESMVVVTDTLPAGLTAVDGSITEDGVYNAAANQVVWHLRALWPGQTRYLGFKAALAPNLPSGVLDNQLDLMGYWEWGTTPGLPPEPERHYFSTSNALTVLPAGATAGGPSILEANLQPGALAITPQVTLLVDASLDARSLYVKEWTLDTASNGWKLVQYSGWVPFTDATMTVDQDGSAQHVRYNYSLAPLSGVHYLGLWVADQNGLTSNLNENDLLYTNLLLPEAAALPAGQRVQYRLPLQAGEQAILNLVVPQGDADLFAWNPRHGFHPDYYSNAGTQVETLAFNAPETGVYIVEVQAVTDAQFLLVAAAGGQVVGLSEQAKAYLDPGAATPEEAAQRLLANAARALPHSLQAPLEDKTLPANPTTLNTPLHLSNAFSVITKYFLPWITNQR